MKMKKALLCAASLVAILSAGPASAGTPADVLVIADKIDDLISLDPAELFEFSAYEYNNNVYDKLIALDPKNLGPLKPGVAESWKVADDGMTYTFKIRKGLKFHSGNPITAHDVVYSLRRAVKLKKTPSFILTQFGFTPEMRTRRSRRWTTTRCSSSPTSPTRLPSSTTA